jgi:hypothetical protein
MLTIIVWSNILLIEIGLILGAALLLSKAANEEDSDDASRMSMTEVLLHTLLVSRDRSTDHRSKCFEGWVPSWRHSVCSGFA